MKNAKELLELILHAHGGLIQWQQWNTIRAHIQMGGITWGVKGHEGVMSDLTFTGSLHEQKDSWSPIFQSDIHSYFDGEAVRLLNSQNKTIEQLDNARASFEGHNLLTPWSRLQLTYFSSYATWNYLTAPFLLATPGFHLLEMDPWEENGETWRRLEAIFPDHLATHSKRQVYYCSQEGLLKRHDYWPEILGNNSATHYYSNYEAVQGIRIPTMHKIYPLDDKDNQYVPEPLLVSIDIKSIRYYRESFEQVAFTVPQ